MIAFIWYMKMDRILDNEYIFMKWISKKKSSLPAVFSSKFFELRSLYKKLIKRNLLNADPHASISENFTISDWGLKKIIFNIWQLV